MISPSIVLQILARLSAAAVAIASGLVGQNATVEHRLTNTALHVYEAGEFFRVDDAEEDRITIVVAG